MGDTRTQPQQRPQSGPPPGTRVIVEVVANDDGAGGVRWSHDWRFDGHPGGNNGAIVIPEKDIGQPGTPLMFQLRDNTRLHLSFASDPIWVARAPNACPSTTASSDPEIIDIQRTPHVLHATDLNQDECTLRYNLRFEPDPDRYYYDPEIRNGGST